MMDNIAQYLKSALKLKVDSRDVSDRGDYLGTKVTLSLTLEDEVISQDHFWCHKQYDVEAILNHEKKKNQKALV